MSCPGPVQHSGYLVSSSFISRSTRLRLFSSLSPTSSVSLRPLHLLLPPLAASFASFFPFFSFHLLISPFSIVGSRSLLFVPRRPHFASPLEAALLHSKEPPSVHPSGLAPRPGLASPHLLSPRIVRHAAVLTGHATGLASHSQSPASSLRLPAVRHPLTGRLVVPLRASSAPITDNPPPALDSYAVKKKKPPGSSPRDLFELVQASLLQQLAALPLPGEAACSVNRHI
ncbi:uncharacterized protein TrAtP1_001445 [Trichoderma atroviride]|uniref:uncharacterized protein n=1 Tax=Hypocrea atroviridis TaxID=63577 RepID=UPI00332E3D8D|nr:hypothetical protein TrAtP1_001445 [Trichoderma atroviride]